MPFLSFLCPDWSDLYLLISLPTIFYVLLWILIPDSPRWLLTHGYLDRTKEVLRQADRINRTSNILNDADLELRLKADMTAAEKQAKPETWWSLWHDHRDFLNMTAVHSAWAIYVTNYNGMLLNVKAFGRDFLSVNTILMGTSHN